MGEYKKPKKQLHHDFLYLDHDAVLNSLSVFEAGKVDEIIEKTAAAREGGFDAGLKAGPAKASAAKKKQETIQEELLDLFVSRVEGHRHVADCDILTPVEGALTLESFKRIRFVCGVLVVGAGSHRSARSTRRGVACRSSRRSRPGGLRAPG